MSLEGGTIYIADQINRMWEIQTDNPNVLTNAGMLQQIENIQGHDPALWSVFKAFVADLDQETDIGLRLRANTYIPMINEVLTKMRQDGIDMDWVTIQLQIALMAHDKGAKDHYVKSNEEYEWSTLGKMLPSRIQRGLRLHKDIYNEGTDFRAITE